ADINTYYEKNADFYLNNFVCSVNAKVNITASKSTDAHGLMSYVVTFSVTSESGSPRTYTHTLKEKNYFDNSTYAYLYADGERVTAITQEAYSALSEADRVKYLSDGIFTYAFNDDDFNGSASSSLADDLFMQVSFNRAKDREPQYRVKYTLSNFYTLGENVVFGPTTATSNNGATVNNTYAGLTVTVSNNNNTGKYVFVYSYTNKGIWENNTEYTRYYEFPELIVEKLASTDALLRKITFLEEAVSLGNTSTVILPNRVLVPTYEDQTVGYLFDDELYNDIFNSTSRKINVAHSGIQYGDYDAPQYTDYFAIGTVSNADLSYYCPTFAIEEHAQMYQYTTLEKLTEYGTGVQTKKDKVILTNHSASNNMYLYVPYTNGTSKEIFLVEIDSNGYWTNVYRTTFNGTNASETVDGKAVTVGAYNVSDKVTANNCLDAPLVAGYRVCDYAGQPTNNNSLFMDYVGTPLEGHFWYVSYVIFSEDKLEGGNLEGNVRYYHISIIDVTNNIQFYVKVYAPTSLNKRNLYLTISENIYDKSDKTLKTDTRQLSAYAVYSNTTYSGTRTDIAGYKIYNTQYDLQTLPSGYFYFHIDLPDGYVAKAYTSMKNQLIKYKQDGETIDEQASGNYTAEPGSFLPYSAIITQKVYLEIVVTEGTGSNSSAWAVATSDIYTRDATYDGLILAETQN
ncbi:MAG: hypothetical protein J5936_05570, partial [Acholeplasmatales bacterium]|nr:hypothetical protein [Acholeplasmatales bacterium]